jgi:hypothetical protein
MLENWASFDVAGASYNRKSTFNGRMAIATAYPPSYLETHTKDDELEIGKKLRYGQPPISIQQLTSLRQ